MNIWTDMPYAERMEWIACSVHFYMVYTDQWEICNGQ